MFLTLEDETGLAQVTVRPDVYEICGATIFSSAALVIRGTAEVLGDGVSLRATGVSTL